ncbi:tRNA (cytidine(34)-2'-O)-methyltransferase [Ruminococcaceae bacterium OttesenSCG-928-D13]|nr:tRNA (cytidine(34)-2'-O)-methyltransferase [Ruminococcaceae bacterium OttesenSCG-928-D13]
MNDKSPILHIALVEPQIPQNTGNVARTCAVTGAALHLVQPMGFVVSDAKLKRAGLDYWDKLNISYYKNLDDFLARLPGPPVLFSTKAERHHSDHIYPPGCCLVFGREDAGLPESLLAAMPEACVRLPMRDSLRSLNLSNTVAVGVYEAMRQWGYPGLT